MNCSESEILLDDHVDGELGTRERAELEAHLAACPGCGRTLEELRALRRAVAALPRELPPGRDLLPGIREAATGGAPGTSRTRRAWLALGAAAAAVLLAAATWLALRGPVGGATVPGEPTVPGGALPAAQLTLAEFEAAEAEFDQAASRLLELLEAREDELSPATRQVLRDNLEIIDRAIADVRAALEADPGDARNGHALNALHRQKVELLWRVSRVSS